MSSWAYKYACHESAVKEGHFIQNKLKRTVYLCSNQENTYYVITPEQHSKNIYQHLRVLETFKAPDERRNPIKLI